MTSSFMTPGGSDVIIIGGGVSGLTAAVALSDLGMRTVIIEKETVLGGRARSWIDAATGVPIHIGPHVLTSYYPSFLRLLDRLKTAGHIAWQSPSLLYTIFDGPRAVEIRASRLPPPLMFGRAMSCDPDLSLRDIASARTVVRFALGLTERDIATLDAHDGAAVLDALGVSPTLMRRYFAFAAMAILNLPLQECSAGTLLRAFRDVASRDAAQVGFPAVGLGDLFVPAAERLLASAGHVILRATSVERIDADNRACLSDGRVLSARHVISTLPPPALAAILPGRADLPWFEPVPYISVYLWFDRKIGSRQFWARSYDEHDLNCDFYDYSNIYHGGLERSFIGSNIIYSHRAAALSDDDIISVTLRELRHNLLTDAPLVHAAVHRVPLGVVAPRPGFEARRPRTRNSIDGLVLAGDWTQTELPSSMESAAHSGWRAAEIIAAREGRHVKLVKQLPPPGLLAQSIASVGRRLPWPARLQRVLSG